MNGRMKHGEKILLYVREPINVHEIKDKRNELLLDQNTQGKYMPIC